MLVDCPNCSAFVDGEIIGSAEIVADPDFPDEPRRRVSLLTCPRCGNPLVAMDVATKTKDFDDSNSAERLWPRTLELSTAIPSPIRHSLNEADICNRAGAFTASIAMSGRALEGVCRHFRTQSEVLAGGLKELLEREIIDKRIYRWGEELRSYRNRAAHATDERLMHREAHELLNFAVAICDFVFVWDYKFEEFQRLNRELPEIMQELKATLEARAKCTPDDTDTTPEDCG